MRYIHTIKTKALHIKQFISGVLVLQVLLELLPPPFNQCSQLVVLDGIQYHGLSWGQVILLVSPPVSPPCLLTLWGLSIKSPSPHSLQNSQMSLGQGCTCPCACMPSFHLPTLQQYRPQLLLSGPGWPGAGSCKVPWQRGVHESVLQGAAKEVWAPPPLGVSGFP